MTEPVHIAAGEFEARCFKLLDEVAESGEGLVITKRGKPVACLVPMPGTRELFGTLAGSVVREDNDGRALPEACLARRPDVMFVGLSVRALLLRRRLGVGDGGDVALAKALRAHANFAEYTPLAVFLTYLLETLASGETMMHVCGSVLVLGRAVHAYGVSRVIEDYRFRVFGMGCTFVVLVGTSLRLLIVSVVA